MLYIILALIFYTIAILLGAAASRNADSNLVTAIVNLISSIIPIAVVIPVFNKKLLENGKLGIILAVLGGIAIALFTLAMNKSFAVNKVAIVSPIVYGGVIVLTAAASYVLFKEKISLIQGIGLLLVVFGIICVVYAKATGK